MTRAILVELLFFLLPFVAFAAYLVIRRRSPFEGEAWKGPRVWLVIAGLLCVIASLIWTGVTAERSEEGFQPTRVEDGKVVPGQFR
jgi:asparagine N-glycosylation enzyme membrane subunit Stt3